MSKIDPFNMPDGLDLPPPDPNKFVIKVMDLAQIIENVAVEVAGSPDRTWGFKRGEILNRFQEILNEAKKISYKEGNRFDY